MFFIRAEDAIHTGGIIHGRCHREKAAVEAPPLLHNGEFEFRAYHVGWIVSGIMAMIATVTTFWLVGKHIKWYTNKHEQRYIVRILFMVPIYAWVSFASYLYWNHSTVLILLRDGYESTVLTSFFYVLLLYIDPDPEGQKDIMRKKGLSRENDEEARRQSKPVKKWALPFGSIKRKPADGLYFLQLMKWGVLQYCVLRPLTTLAAVVLDYIGLYCEQTYSPRWGAIWILIIVSISVTIAMYCLIQFYVCVADDLKPKQPLLKLFAIKAVVFLTFWQMFCLGLLASWGIVKDTKYMTAEDINIGFGALLQTFEMMCFAFLHIKAFSYKPYVLLPDSPTITYIPRYWRMRALGHAFDFRETFRELWDGCTYMAYRLRGKETDHRARRVAVMEHALGRSRGTAGEKRPLAEYEDNCNSADGYPLPLPAGGSRLKVQVSVERRYDVAGERQWLDIGDRRARHEKSNDLEIEIERELQTRGYTLRSPSAQAQPKFKRHYLTAHGRDRSSWWRRTFDRFSQSSGGVGSEHAPHLSPMPVQRRERRSPRPSWTYSHRQQKAEWRPDTQETLDYDDPPPPSIIRTLRKDTRPRRNINSYVYGPVVQESSYALGDAYLTEEDAQLLSLDDYNRHTQDEGLLFAPTQSAARQLRQLSRRREQEPEHPHIFQPVPNSHASPVLFHPEVAHVNRSDSLLGRIFSHTDGGHSAVVKSVPSAKTSAQSYSALLKPQMGAHVRTADAASELYQVWTPSVPSSSRGVIQVGSAYPYARSLSLTPEAFKADINRNSRMGMPFHSSLVTELASPIHEFHTGHAHPDGCYFPAQPGRYTPDERQRSERHLIPQDRTAMYMTAIPRTSRRLDTEVAGGRLQRNLVHDPQHASSRSAVPPAPLSGMYSPLQRPLGSASEGLPFMPVPTSMRSPTVLRHTPAQIVLPMPFDPRVAEYDVPSPSSRHAADPYPGGGIPNRQAEDGEDAGPSGYTLHPEALGEHSLQLHKVGERDEATAVCTSRPRTIERDDP